MTYDFHEGTVRELRPIIIPGYVIHRKFWSDADAPEGYAYRNRADSVKWDDQNDYVEILTHYYTESGRKENLSLHYAYDDVVAVMTASNTHRDSRLYLREGWLRALPGENLRFWEVNGYPDEIDRKDGSEGYVIADRMSTYKAREFLRLHGKVHRSF